MSWLYLLRNFYSDLYGIVRPCETTSNSLAGCVVVGVMDVLIADLVQTYGIVRYFLVKQQRTPLQAVKGVYTDVHGAHMQPATT